MRYLIALGGDFIKPASVLCEDLQNYDFIWAVDRGLVYLHELNLVPNKVLGDMDSVPEDLLKMFQKDGREIAIYPRSKDFTDGELAFRDLESVLQKGDVVHLLGAMGSERPDHQANVQAMADRVRGLDVDVLLTDGQTWQYMLRPKQLYTWHFAEGRVTPNIVSLLAGSEPAEGIVTQGLAYSLEDETLLCGESRGLSNLPCTDCKQIKISFQKGLLNLYFLYTNERIIAPDEAYYKM